METIVASRGYESTRTPGIISMKVAETKGIWPTFCAFFSIIGAGLAWFCDAVTGSHGVGVAVAVVFVGPPLLWWLIVSLRSPGPLTIHLTNDSMVVRSRRYLRNDIREIRLRTPGGAAFFGFGSLGTLEAAAKAHLAGAALQQRYGLVIQYGSETITLTTQLTQVVAEDIGREIKTWLDAPADEHTSTSATDLVRLASAAQTGKTKVMGRRLIGISLAGWVVAILAYGSVKSFADLVEGLAALLLFPLLGPAFLMGTPRNNHGVTHPPDVLFFAAGIAFWFGVILLIRAAWRGRRRSRPIAAE